MVYNLTKNFLYIFYIYYKIEINYNKYKLLYLYTMSIYEKNLSEPWFSLIKLGCKKIEGRLNKGDFVNMNIGDFILFTNNELGFERKFKIQIKNISYYDNFQTYLENETLEKCLPGIDNIEDGLNVYYKYYKKCDELQYKIKAFAFYTLQDLKLDKFNKLKL
jgi:ASC-1-like (ASCH) protein